MSALSDLIAVRLRDAGVRALFGVPGGGGNLDLIASAGRAGVRFVLTSTETGSALAALAQAEVTGRPGACLATLGPGAASLVNGVACAFLDRAPVIVFTDRHPLVAGGRYTHQQLDQRALFAPITKWSTTLSAGALAAALRIAIDAPPGPVHIDCPDDADAGEPASGFPPLHESPAHDWGKQLFESVSASRRPLVIVGLGARNREDAAAICELCESRRVPAMVTYKAKGVVSDGHPCFAGVFTNAAIERPLVEASDLIIGLGLDPVELLPRPWPYRQPVIAIGPWRVPEHHVPFGLQCITDVAQGLGALERALSASTWTLEEIARDRERQRELVAMADGAMADGGRGFSPADFAGPEGPAYRRVGPAGPEGPASRGTGSRGLTPQRVVAVAAERLAGSHRVTVDAGAHMVPATMLWPVAEPNGMLISNGLSTMGFALPAAIGAAVAEPETPVVALTGDGGLLMCASELLTAAREKLRIITIVFSDASLSLIEIKQQQKRYPESGVALGPVNWTALAQSVGVTPFVARDASELARAIDEATRQVGPSLVEVRIDRSNYARTFQAVRG